jgi:hypothetical protein
MKAVTEEELDKKICPHIRGLFGNKPCVREKCLSFGLQEGMEWDETKLRPVGDFEHGETRDADVTTGRRICADIGSCALGVFGRALLNVRVTGSAVPEGEMKTDRDVVVPGVEHGETS